MREDIGLVLDDREYAQEEEERRGGPFHGADGGDGNGQSSWNPDDSDNPYGGGNELESGVEEDLLRSTPSPPAQDPKNDTLPVGVQDPEQLNSLYGTTPPADATITISPVDKPMQGITVGSRRLEGVFADLKTYGGVLTLPDAGTSGTLNNVRQSTEVEETRVTVAQSGSTTAETTTTAVMVSTEIVETLPTPTLPGIEIIAPDSLEVPFNLWLNLTPEPVFVPIEKDPFLSKPREAQEPTPIAKELTPSSEEPTPPSKKTLRQQPMNKSSPPKQPKKLKAQPRHLPHPPLHFQHKHRPPRYRPHKFLRKHLPHPSNAPHANVKIPYSPTSQVIELTNYSKQPQQLERRELQRDRDQAHLHQRRCVRKLVARRMRLRARRKKKNRGKHKRKTDEEGGGGGGKRKRAKKGE
jgi:hypothetical protein